MADNSITQPLSVDPERIIERVYEHNGEADVQSQDDFEQYLVDRMYGEDSEVAEKFKPGTDGTVTERIRDGWVLRPRTALIATLASSLALSLAGVKMPVVGNLVDKLAADPIGDAIDGFDPKYKIQHHQTSKPQSFIEYLRMRVSGKEQQSGQAEHDTATAQQLVARVEEIGDTPQKTVTGIRLVGTASDEWLQKGDSSLGVKDAENTKLSGRRGAVVKSAILEAADDTNVDMPEIEIAGQEKVLGPKGLGQLLSLTNRNGYSTIGEAVKAYNSGEKIDPQLKTTIRHYLGGNRTVLAGIEYESVTSVGEYQDAPEATRIDEDHKIPFMLLPIPPIPRFRRLQRNLFDTPPSVKEDPPEKAWIELYPEAMKRGSKLVDNAWSLTRKYQALLREERLKGLASYEYKDEDNKLQAFQVAFVDHKPTEVTFQAISELLGVISKMNRGKIPERLNMIAVYPSSQTGRQHPKKIGLGIDEQYDSSVQGVAIPALSLVEMHMPTEPTIEEIEQFNGMKWVMAHEIAGHFTDVKSQPVKLIKAASHTSTRKDYHTSNPWLDSTIGEFGVVGKWAAVPTESRQFSIPSQREAESDVKTDEFIVGPDDPKLKEAEFVRLSGIAPTAYGGENVQETQAETAAQATTEILVPFKESGVSGRGKTAKGYAVDAGLLSSFAKRVGSQLNFDHLKWTPAQIARIRESWTKRFGNIHSDKAQRKISEKAKNTPYQPAEKRLRVLANQKD